MLLGSACHFAYLKQISSVLLLPRFLLKHIVDTTQKEKNNRGAGSLFESSKPALLMEPLELTRGSI